MNKVLLLLIPAFFCLYSSFAQTDEDAIRNVINAQVIAWNSGNINEFMETYWKSDSVMFIGSAGPNYGWQATLEKYKTSYPDTVAMGKLSFDILQVKPLSAEYYFVSGKWHLRRTIGNLGGYFTLLFQKMNNKWVIVVDHTS